MKKTMNEPLQVFGPVVMLPIVSTTSSETESHVSMFWKKLPTVAAFENGKNGNCTGDHVLPQST